MFLGGEGLQPTSTATTVRVRDGEPLLTDGPFAETREQLAGFYLLDCGDLDDAVRWAAKIPSAARGSVEVRPVIDYEGRRARARPATRRRTPEAPMRFLLLIYDDESGSEDATPEQFAAMLAEYGAYDRAVQEAGVFVSGEGLQPTATATHRPGARRRAAASPTARSRRRASSSAASTCSTVPTSTRRSRWAARIPVAADGRRRGAPGDATTPAFETAGRRRRAAAGLSAGRRRVDRLFRRESAQAVATLARALGDLDLAEEAVQDAFAAALERWPARRRARRTRRRGS